MPEAKIPVPKKARKVGYKLRLWKAKMKFHKSETNTTIDLPQFVIHATGCPTYTDLAKDQSDIDWAKCKNIVVKEKNTNNDNETY